MGWGLLDWEGDGVRGGWDGLDGYVVLWVVDWGEDGGLRIDRSYDYDSAMEDSADTRMTSVRPLKQFALRPVPTGRPFRLQSNSSAHSKTKTPYPPN